MSKVSNTYIRWRDRKLVSWIREQTKVEDNVMMIKKWTYPESVEVRADIGPDVEMKLESLQSRIRNTSIRLSEV